MDYCLADVRTIAGYYPFGSLMPGRFASAGDDDYRYSFQGQEHDDEFNSTGNSINYAFSENRVIDGIYLEGLEYLFTADGKMLGKFGRTQ